MYGYEKRPPGRLASILAGSWPVYLVVLAVLSCGLLVGAMSASKMEKSKSDELGAYVKDFVQKVEGISFEKDRMARNAMVNNTLMVAAIYVLGLTVIGMPVTLAIIFVRGFVIGFAVGFLTSQSLSGMLLTMAAILPHNLLYLPAICIGAASSLMFSAVLLKRNFNTAVRIWPGLLKYTAAMSAVLLITLAAGLVEGYLTPYFTKLAAEAISSGFRLK